MLRWYLIHAKPSAEGVAQRNLERQGYETYLPRLLQSTFWRGQRRERVVPLFPRYLFLRLREGHQALGPVRSTTGVAQAVRFGSRYAVIGDEVVAELRARADPVTGLHRLRPRRRLDVGTIVRIAAGPFDGVEAIFERHAGGDRVVVLLKLLGQDASVCVPEDAILAA